jgi:hypothetical protein
MPEGAMVGMGPEDERGARDSPGERRRGEERPRPAMDDPNRVPGGAAAEVDDHDAMSLSRSRSRCSPLYSIRCELAAMEMSGGLVGQGQVD